MVNVNVRVTDKEFMYSLEMEDKSRIIFISSKVAVSNLQKLQYPDLSKYLYLDENETISLGHLVYFVGDESISIVKFRELNKNNTTYIAFRFSLTGIEFLEFPKETQEAIEIVMEVLQEKTELFSCN